MSVDVRGLQDLLTTLQGGGDGSGAARDHPLHEQHQEAEVLAVLTDRLVIAEADVLRDRLVELPLELVAVLPGDGDQLRHPGHEQRLTPVVDRLPLLGADHVPDDLLLADGAGAEELVPVQEGHDPLEGVGLALVGGRRQQEQERGGVGECLAQPVAGDQLGAAAQPVSFVADDQVPASGDQVAQAFLVVGFELLSGPAPPLLDRLDGVDRADDLIEVPPDVLGAGQVAPEGELAGGEELELLVEVGLHLLDPLGHQPLGGDDQDSLDQPPELEFPEDQPRLDRLAQADLIGQEVADAVVGHRPRQGVELVGQRDHPGFERCQQHVLGQGVGDAGGGGSVDEPVEGGLPGLLLRGQGFGGEPLDRVLAGDPDLADGVVPDGLHVEDADGLPVSRAEDPGANGNAC